MLGYMPVLWMDLLGLALWPELYIPWRRSDGSLNAPLLFSKLGFLYTYDIANYELLLHLVPFFYIGVAFPHSSVPQVYT